MVILNLLQSLVCLNMHLYLMYFIEAFGEASVETLVKHFRKRFTADESEIFDQFHHLKSVLYTR